MTESKQLPVDTFVALTKAVEGMRRPKTRKQKIWWFFRCLLPCSFGMCSKLGEAMLIVQQKEAEERVISMRTILEEINKHSAILNIAQKNMGKAEDKNSDDPAFG